MDLNSVYVYMRGDLSFVSWLLIRHLCASQMWLNFNQFIIISVKKFYGKCRDIFYYNNVILYVFLKTK